MKALILVNLFYDAPTAPAGLFNAFLAIPAVVTDISTRSYLSLILSANTDLTAGMRYVARLRKPTKTYCAQPQRDISHHLTHSRHPGSSYCHAK